MQVSTKTLIDFEIIPPVLAHAENWDKVAIKSNYNKLTQYSSDIDKHLDDLYAEMENFRSNTEDYKTLSSDAKKYEEILKSLKTEISNLSKSF